jgi:hypothetical protein
MYAEVYTSAIWYRATGYQSMAQYVKTYNVMFVSEQGAPWWRDLTSRGRLQSAVPRWARGAANSNWFRGLLVCGYLIYMSGGTRRRSETRKHEKQDK